MIKFDKPIVEIKNLVKKYGEVTILDDLTFQIPKGKIVTVLGFSGAGKSTLLKHILGLVRPTSGSISVVGKDITKIKNAIALNEMRRNFGMLFQYAALFDSLSAFDNVAFPMREFTTWSEEEIYKKVDHLLDSVSIKSEAYGRLPSELSGGMRKRVGLARALALDPAIMLYDEPTTGLDPITTKKVNDLILNTARKNADREMTSLIISHDVKASLAISDYIAFLDHGRIVEYLPVNEFEKSTHPLVLEFINL